MPLGPPPPSFSAITGLVSDNAALTAALAAKSDKALTINAQVGTTYTLALTDAAGLVTLDNASSITLTVPPNASVAFAVGTQIVLAQLGAGQVTVAAGSGVTVNVRGSRNKINGQYGVASLIKTATNTWLLGGDLTT